MASSTMQVKNFTLIRMTFSYRKIIAMAVLPILPALAGCGPNYSQEELLKRNSAPLERKLDLTSPDNPLVFDFDADWGSPYRFFLIFKPIHGRWTDDEWDEFDDFLGDSAQMYVTAESANTDHPIGISEFTPDDLDFMKHGGMLVPPQYAKHHTLKPNERVRTLPQSGGVYIWAYPGTTVPIHYKIEKLSESRRVVEVIEERTIDTKGAAMGAGRDAGGAALEPGHYRISINVTQPIELPPNTEALIQLDRRRLK